MVKAAVEYLFLFLTQSLINVLYCLVLYTLPHLDMLDLFCCVMHSII